MSVLTDTLTKSGYELISIGAEIFPCTIMLGGEPIGFLKQDGAVSLLPEYEPSRRELESIAEYSREFGSLEQSSHGLIMTRYQDTFLAVEYNPENHAPVYQIYKEQENGEPQRIEVTADRNAAVSQFMGLSGLVRGQTEEPQKDTDKQKEYEVKPQEKKYSITNRNGEEVGYIGKNGMAVMYSSKSEHTEPHQPSFFSRLKEKLAEIGLAIRVHFRRSGAHYAIHDKEHDIAYISPEHQISYTSYATPEQTKKIDALVAEILAERKEPAREQERAAEAPVKDQEKEQDVQQPDTHSALVQEADRQQETPDEKTRKEREIVLRDFERGKEELNLLSGFHPEAESRKKAAFLQLFGTENKDEFLADLKAGKYDNPKLQTDLNRIELKNELFGKEDVSRQKGEMSHVI